MVEGSKKAVDLRTRGNVIDDGNYVSGQLINRTNAPASEAACAFNTNYHCGVASSAFQLQTLSLSPLFI